MMTIMHKNSVQFFHMFILFFLLHMKPAFSGIKGAKFRCIERERQTLLKFKQELEDISGVLSSWGSEEEKSDCCKWRGVGCNNRTGHVTLLDLHGGLLDLHGEFNYVPLSGKISYSLLELQHLNYLDLSHNAFRGTPFPNFIGSLSKLKYLNLSNSEFTGTLSYHLGNLTNLHFLDLRGNQDMSSENLDWLSHFSSLEFLDLSFINLSMANDWLQAVSKLPHLKVMLLSRCSLSNIISPPLSFINSSKSLAVLDLSSNNLASSIFPWLSNFSISLVHLDLSNNDLRQATDWLQVVNKLTHLEVLRLPNCGLSDSIPLSLSSINSSKSLAVLDLSSNNLASSIFPWLSNFGISLIDLDLSNNQLQGISRSFQQMCSLRALDLSSNNLSGRLVRFFKNLHGCMENSLEILMVPDNELHGSLPDITRFPSMRELDLSSNQLNGTLPKRFRQHSKLETLILSGNQLTGSLTDVAMLSSLRELRIYDNRLDGNVSESIGRLSELESLILGGNSLQGVISEAHFSNLSKLKELDLSHNSLYLKFEYDWAPPFRLDVISLRSCNLGPYFPLWLKNQYNSHVLDISGAGISDAIPGWFWDLFSISGLNLSHNNMRGILPDLSSLYRRMHTVDLSSNRFEGPLPPFPSKTKFLDLSNNLFSGPISSLCKIGGEYLKVLDLSDNRLSGELPNCLQAFEALGIIVLSNNNISGEIPSSIGSLSELSTLSLRNNSFSGELPLTLKNCTNMQFLDLSENKLDGEIPSWLGESLLILKFLSLQHNKFYGSIPLQLCQLSDIQILDLSLNNISGIIPKCLNNFTAMIQESEETDLVSSGGSVGFIYDTSQANKPVDFAKEPYSFTNKAWVAWKGREYEYEKNLGLLRIIDFAGNKLIGEIPEEIMALLQLVALNLSGNNLTGAIPPKIGQLKQLESLDLSANQLSGVIPSTMADLNFLNYLNFSYNKLYGKIPSSTQLQSFNSSAFTGNLALCGLPLTQKCPGDETPPSLPPNDNSQGNEEHVDEFWKWFYTAMGIGFSVFFWGVSSALLLKRSWRHTYFQYLDEAWDWIYVKIAVHKASLSKKFQILS